jgi:quinol monooxygenase YgiN
MKRISIFAKITPKPEYLNETRQALSALISPTLDEDGCHAFCLNEDSEGHLYLYEEFDSEAALKLHSEKPYTKAVFAQYEIWLVVPIEATRMKRLA